MQHSLGIIPLTGARILDRLGYYGVRSLIMLYMINSTIQFSHMEAAKTYSLFIGIAAFSSILGGVFGDFVLGSRLCGVIGSGMQALGCFVLCIPSAYALYAGMILIAVGQGLIAPNSSSQIAILYRDRPKAVYSAFTILYVAANVGAVLSQITIQPIQEWFGFQAAFIISGLLLLGSSCVLLFGGNMLADLPLHANYKLQEQQQSRLKNPLALIGLILLVLLVPVYWYCSESANMTTHLMLDRSENLFGIGVKMISFSYLFEGILTVIAGIVLAILWTFVSMSPFLKLFIGFTIFALSCTIIWMVGGDLHGNPLLFYLITLQLLQAVSELFISPLVLAYITTHVPLRFNALITSAYLIVNHLAILGASMLFSTYDVSKNLALFLVIAGILIVIAGVWLLLYFLSRAPKTVDTTF